MRFFKRLWDKIPFTFSQKGLWVRYKYDDILHYWSWRSSFKDSFYSKTLKKEYLSKTLYEHDLDILLQTPSSFETKLVGFKTSDLIRCLVKDKFPYGYFVTMHDINPMKKSSDFWRALPEKKAVVLLEDVVVLGWKNGLLIDGNYEDEISN